MKKYFYKYSSETLKEALDINGISFDVPLANTKKQCESAIQKDKDEGIIDNRVKPKIYEISIKEIKGDL